VAPVSVVGGLVMATAFHNAAHYNIRPKWLAIASGELMGAWVMDGMRTFRVGHTLHHAYADDPVRDPHPPKGLGFVEFLAKSRKRTVDTLKAEYLRVHGDTPAHRANLVAQEVFFYLGVALKLLCWVLLLGPWGLAAIYVPSFLAYFFGFGHLNWISHLPDDDGVVRMKNHDGTLFYRVMNRITAGGDYHRDHHHPPTHYHPPTPRGPLGFGGVTRR
jgi:stearoyl-CoA desaturase (delta-9 desaturase)